MPLRSAPRSSPKHTGPRAAATRPSVTGHFLGRVLPFVLLTTTAPLGGCDTGLQAKLHEGRDRRYKAAKEAVYDVEAARNKAMVDTLPAPDAKFDGDNHPMMVWRRNATLRPDLNDLDSLATRSKPRRIIAGEALAQLNEMRKQAKLPLIDERWVVAPPLHELNELRAQANAPALTEEQYDQAFPAHVGAKGTPAEEAAKVGAGYLKDASEFWAGTTTLSRYMTSIGNFDLAVNKAKTKAEEDGKTKSGWEFVEPPFGDEARFDEWFVHAASYLQLSNLSDRSVAWDAMHPAYGVAFGISRRQGEGSSDYVSRLCFLHDSLKDKCKGVPHEYRSALVDRGFLEVMLGWAKGYHAKSPRGEVFDSVAKRFADAITAAIAAPLEFKEGLVLPSTTAAVGGRSGVRLALSDAGIVATGEADVKLSDKWTGTVPANFVPDFTKMLTDIKDQPGNRIDYQRVVLELAGSTSIGQFMGVLKAIPAKLGEAGGVKEVFLLGRRRLDDSMRLAAIRVRIPAADDAPNMGYKFKEDAAQTQCLVVGRVGDPPVGKKDEYDIEIKANQIRAAKVTIVETETSAERVYEDTANLGTPADLKPLKDWLDAHPGRMRLFIPNKGDYNQLVTLLSDLLYKCTDEEVSSDDASKPKAVRTCGVSEPRAASFVLGLCD